MQDRLRNSSWQRWVLCQSLKEVRDIGYSQCVGPWAELISITVLKNCSWNDGVVIAWWWRWRYWRGEQCDGWLKMMTVIFKINWIEFICVKHLHETGQHENWNSWLKNQTLYILYSSRIGFWLLKNQFEACHLHTISQLNNQCSPWFTRALL